MEILESSQEPARCNEERFSESLRDSGFDISSPLTRFILASCIEDSENTVRALFRDLDGDEIEAAEFAALALTRLMNRERYKVFRSRHLSNPVSAASAAHIVDRLAFGDSVVVQDIPDARSIKRIIDKRYELNISLYPQSFPEEPVFESFMIMVVDGSLRLVVYRVESPFEGQQQIYEGDASVEKELRNLGIIGARKASVVFTRGGSWCPVTLPCVGIDGHSHPTGEKESLMPTRADIGTNWALSELKRKSGRQLI